MSRPSIPKASQPGWRIINADSDQFVSSQYIRNQDRAVIMLYKRIAEYPSRDFYLIDEAGRPWPVPKAMKPRRQNTAEVTKTGGRVA